MKYRNWNYFYFVYLIRYHTNVERNRYDYTNPHIACHWREQKEWVLYLKTWERHEERLLGRSSGFDGKIWRLTTICNGNTAVSDKEIWFYFNKHFLSQLYVLDTAQLKCDTSIWICSYGDAGPQRRELGIV